MSVQMRKALSVLVLIIIMLLLIVYVFKGQNSNPGIHYEPDGTYTIEEEGLKPQSFLTKDTLIVLFYIFIIIICILVASVHMFGQQIERLLELFEDLYNRSMHLYLL